MMRLCSLYMFIILVMTSSCSRVERAKYINSEVPYARIFFSFDQDEVQKRENQKIDRNADWMKANKDVVIVLEGHTDEVGPKKYNLILGDRRARSVMERLIKMGVPYQRIVEVISFGELRPIDTRHNRKAWSKNRRVEFIIR